MRPAELLSRSKIMSVSKQVFTVVLLFVICWTFYTVLDLSRYSTSLTYPPYLPSNGNSSPTQDTFSSGQRKSMTFLTKLGTVKVQTPPETGAFVQQPIKIFNPKLDCRREQGFKNGPNVLYLSSMTTNEAFLIPYLRRRGLNVQKGLGVRREVLESSFEGRLLCTPPLTDFALLPSENTSKVILLDPKRRYKVGDKIEFRVDLFDGRGMSRSTGNDEIRMWLTSPEGANSVPVRVLDLNNGSYSGVIKLMWPGVTLVKVALTYPREFLRVLVELRHTSHSLHWISAIFVNNNGIKEETVCLASLPIPGYATACNFTTINGGFPFYCGRPTHPGLTCDHWELSGDLGFLAPLQFRSEHVAQMVRRIDSPPYEKLIPNKIAIATETGSKRIQTTLPPCWSRPKEESWMSHTPRGWIGNGAWHASGCTLPLMTTDHVSQCMKDTGLLLLGDSNQRLFYNEIKGLLKRVLSNCKQAGKRFVECKMPALNSSLILSPHAKPYNIGGKNAGTDLRTKSLSQAIQILLQHNRTNNVVVVHHYVHNSFYPVHMYRGRVQFAREVIENVLDAYPRIKIIIRGPHVIYRGKQHHAHFGDNFGPWYMQIWKEEFQGRYDRVWFLDMWDLSIAMENPSSHPPHHIVMEMIKAMFGYFCER